MQQQPQQQQLPPLPYALDALEPVISAEIMNLHYNKHHKAYVDNYNKAFEQFLDAERRGDLTKMIELQTALKFNGGGHINHSIFWTNLAPVSSGKSKAPKGALGEAIDTAFGGFDNFKEKMSAKAVGIQGSGWAWLGVCKSNGRLAIRTCANQDPLLDDITPLLGFDVWEHAYYLQYKNVRADYVKKLWEIVNWENVAERFAAAKK